MAMQAGIVLIILAYSSRVDGKVSPLQTASLSAASVNTSVSTNLTSDVSVPSSDVISKVQLFRVEKVAYSTETTCWIHLQTAFPKASAERLSRINISKVKEADRWNLNNKWVGCCEELMEQMRAKLRFEYKDYTSYLKELSEKLLGANCKRLYCNETYCTTVQCSQLKSCVTLSTSTPLQSSSPSSSSSSSPSSTSGDVIDTSTSTQPTGGNTATNTGGEKTGKTTIIVIVVACLIAFLAGIGGAFIFICVRKRWRRGAQSKAADAVIRDKRETELSTIPANTAPPETKADARNTTTYNMPTARLSINEHVYSSINDEPHNPETTKTTKTSRLQDRKLPTAPAPSAPPQPFAEKASRDHTARAGQGTQSENSYAKQPGKEGEHLVKKVETQDRQPLPENPPTGGDYFILEDEDREQTDNKQTKEKEGQMNSVETSRRGDTHGRERILDGASVRGEYYSPLNLAGGQADNSEYTALDLAQTEEKEDVGASHDYLDVLSDYELSKPIR